MKMKKLLLTLSIFLTTCLTGCGETTIQPASREDQFVVGMECAYAPFNWTESSQTAYNHPIEGTSLYCDGYDVSMAKAVAASLGKVLVVKAIEWDGLIPALESEQIDAIIAGMSPTEERKLSVDFTEAYYKSTHVLVMNKDSQYVNGKTLNDFSGAKIVGQKETLYDSLIDQLVGASHETPLDDVPTIITAITSGRADITILEEPVAIGVIASNPNLTYVKLESGFNVTDEDVCVSIALKKGQTELVTQINGILSSITQDVREKLMVSAIARAEE